MAERRDDYVEITLRLLPGTLGELMRQLGAAMGGGTAAPAAETSVPMGTEESGSFEEERFRELQRQETEPPVAAAEELDRPMGAELPAQQERAVWEAAPLPQRQEREMEESRYDWRETVVADPAEQERQAGEAAAPEGPVRIQMETIRRETGVTATETADPAELSAVYERDARRYDGAFPLY